MIVAATLLSLVSCKNEISFGGVTIELPDDFEEKNVEFTQCCYTTEEVMLMIDVYLSEDITEQLGYASNITLEEYMDEFYMLNGTKAELNIDAERGMAHFAEYNPDGDRYYEYYIFRTARAFYFVVFNCLTEYESKYDSIFSEWAETITVK